MWYVKNVKTNAKQLIVVILLVSVVVPGFTASAQGGEVQVMVCPRPSESHFTITSPVSDSIVNEAKVAITGDTKHISQIDFHLNGTYNHTQALGSAAVNFSSTVVISPGTHTLRLIASDSCSRTTHEQTVVITYEPRVAPSVGTAVATTVDDSEIGTEPVGSIPDQNMFERYVMPPIRHIADGLDLSDPPRAEGDSGPLPSVSRAALFVAGASLVVSSVYISTLTVLPAHLTLIVPHRRLFLGAILTVGVILIAVVFTV